MKAQRMRDLPIEAAPFPQFLPYPKSLFRSYIKRTSTQSDRWETGESRPTSFKHMRILGPVAKDLVLRDSPLFHGQRYVWRLDELRYMTRDLRGLLNDLYA